MLIEGRLLSKLELEGMSVCAAKISREVKFTQTISDFSLKSINFCVKIIFDRILYVVQWQTEYEIAATYQTKRLCDQVNHEETCKHVRLFLTFAMFTYPSLIYLIYLYSR